MKKAVTVLLLLIFIGSISFLTCVAQEETAIQKKRHNTIFTELLGQGNILSLNYERLFWVKDKFFIAPRLGVGLIGGHGGVSFGYGQRSALEVGYTYGKALDGLAIMDYDPANREMIFNTFTHLLIGYRLMGKSGFFLRLTAGLRKTHIKSGFWPGISTGWVF